MPDGSTFQPATEAPVTAAPDIILRTARADFSKTVVGADEVSAEGLISLVETRHFCDADHWYEAPPVEDVIAEHCMGGSFGEKAFTRLTRRKPWAAGGTFIANLAGHLPQGHIEHIQHNGRAYRLCFPETV